MSALVHDLSFLHTLSPGAPTAIAGRILVPLLGGAPVDADASLLEEAIALKEARLDETSESGTVGQLVVHNLGKKLLLLIDGEQVVGGKQNRVFNASFLVGPDSEVVVPVSCVEQGRWAKKGEFTASATLLSPKIHREKVKRTSRSLRASGRYNSGQGDIWRDIDEHLESTQTMSPSAAYEDSVRSRRRHIERRSERLPVVDGQLGLALVEGGRVCLVHLFASPTLYARAHRKLLSGVLADVPVEGLWSEAGAGELPRAVLDGATRAVRSTLDDLQRIVVERRRAPGVGETLTGESSSHVVNAVTHGGATYHLMAVAS